MRLPPARAPEPSPRAPTASPVAGRSATITNSATTSASAALRAVAWSPAWKRMPPTPTCARAATSSVPLGIRDTNFQSRTDFVGTVRGRLGLAFGNLLVFGSGGFAYGGVKDSINYYTNGIHNYAGASDTIRAGYAYGGGIEYAIPTASFLNPFHAASVTVKAEYLHFRSRHFNNRRRQPVRQRRCLRRARPQRRQPGPRRPQLQNRLLARTDTCRRPILSRHPPAHRRFGTPTRSRAVFGTALAPIESRLERIT